MGEENAKPEGPADVGEPAEEGAEVRPHEEPEARNMSGRFPGEANEKPRPNRGLNRAPAATEKPAEQETVEPKPDRSESRH